MCVCYLLDAWAVNSWVVKEPTTKRPDECDELSLGAPYLSELKPRTLLVHLKSVFTHLSRVRKKEERKRERANQGKKERSTTHSSSGA